MNRATTAYNRHTRLFEVSHHGAVVASGETWTAAWAARCDYEAKRYQDLLNRVNVALILICPIPAPTPATPNGKRPKGQRKAPRPVCLCPACMNWAGDLDAAVHRCKEMQAFCVYYAGEYRSAHDTYTEATVALNQLKHAHLRSVA